MADRLVAGQAELAAQSAGGAHARPRRRRLGVAGRPVGVIAPLTERPRRPADRGRGARQDRIAVERPDLLVDGDEGGHQRAELGES